MVAQQVTQTCGHTHPRTKAMADHGAAKSSSGKRLRGLPAGEATAGGPAPDVAPCTLQELTERVAKLEQGRIQDMAWWKECGSIVNEHARDIEEAKDELLNANDRLHLISDNAKEALEKSEKELNARIELLGADLVESLKVVEAEVLAIITATKADFTTVESSLKTLVQEVKGEFEKFRADSIKLTNATDTKVREIEANLAVLQGDVSNGPSMQHIHQRISQVERRAAEGALPGGQQPAAAQQAAAQQPQTAHVGTPQAMRNLWDASTVGGAPSVPQ